MNDPVAPAHRGVTPSPSLVPSLERGYLGECGSELFYYQFWLTNRPTRDIMRVIWIKKQDSAMENIRMVREEKALPDDSCQLHVRNSTNIVW